MRAADEEILELYHQVKEPERRFQQKMKVWRRLYWHLRKEFDDFNLIPFGSTMTGFGLQDSDLDIVLLLPEAKLEMASDRISVLERCQDALLAAKDKYLRAPFELIDCRIPILVLKDTSTSPPLKIELSCAVADKLDGTRNTHLLLSYSDLDPRVRQLMVVLKKWAEFHLLLGTRHKRLSGYSLALMLIFYLQRTSVPVLPVLQKIHPKEFGLETPIVQKLNYTFQCQESIISSYSSKNKESLSTLLQGFFDFYSHFSYNCVISVRTGKTLIREYCSRYSEEKEQEGREWYREVLVEDPIFR